MPKNENFYETVFIVILVILIIVSAILLYFVNKINKDE